MPSRILVIDGVATNRIVLKAQFTAARYEVDGAACLDRATSVLRKAPPDLVLLAASEGDRAAAAFCRQMKQTAKTADIPVIVYGDFSDPERRLMALKAGADDVLSSPLSEQILQARIRSLLRARNAASELRLREDTDRALGFAEERGHFAATAQPGCVQVVCADPDQQAARMAVLAGMTGFDCRAVSLQAVLDTEDTAGAPPPDVVMMDGRGQPEAALARDLPRLAADIRSRAGTRRAGQIALIPAGADDLGALLLDVGVDDVIEGSVSDSELGLRLTTVLRRVQQHERLRETVRDGLLAAVTDPLTGLYNRRYAQPHLARMAARAKTSGGRIAMMILDLDHFKAVNDTYGHAAGDRILIETARRLTSNLRSVDLVARIGGEEFLVALPNTTVEEASRAAERLRHAICDVPFDIGGLTAPITVTMSIGVAMSGARLPKSPDAEVDLDALFDRADAALYRAKSSGRNAVNLAKAAA